MSMMGIVGVMGATTAVSAQPEPPASPATGDTVIIIQPGQPTQIVPSAPPGQGPGATPQGGAQPAPQNESWDNVSHVNGTPVPVGERNDYLIKFRRTNLSINPVGLMFGFYSASLSFAVNENIAIRGEVSFVEIPDSSEGYTEVGVGVPIYLRRTYQGPFLEPGLISRTSENDDRTSGPQVLVGWHWSYESGLNLAVAVGGGRDLDHDDEYDSDAGQFFNGYFRVGYAF
jgi:hypothetical protein